MGGPDFAHCILWFGQSRQHSVKVVCSVAGGFGDVAKSNVIADFGDNGGSDDPYLRPWVATKRTKSLVLVPDLPYAASLFGGHCSKSQRPMSPAETNIQFSSKIPFNLNINPNGHFPIRVRIESNSIENNLDRNKIGRNINYLLESAEMYIQFLLRFLAV